MGIEELVEKGFLSRIPPAPDLAEKEWKESEYDLRQAEQELETEGYKWAIIKGYYAMFHAAKAILFGVGLKERSHYAVGEVLEAVSKEGKLESNYVSDFRAAREAREASDYRYTHTLERAQMVVEMAREFILRMKKLEK